MKDYSRWMAKKTGINNNNGKPFFNEREIWWCSIGLNVGVEIDGKNNNYMRPVLIFKKQGKDSFYGIPSTSKNKKDKKYYYRYKIKDTKSTFLLSQIRIYDAKRLMRKMETMDNNDFMALKNKLIDFLK